MQRACNLPKDRDTRGQKGEEGVGGMPRILLCTVHTGGVEGGRGLGDTRPETQEPGEPTGFNVEGKRPQAGAV